MYAKVIKIFSYVLLLVGIVLSAIILFGNVKMGQNENLVDPVLYWAYILVGVGLVGAIVGSIVSIIDNPKGLKKSIFTLVGVIVVIGIAYLLAPGTPAIGLVGIEPTASTLKMTDTLLNLTYILLGGAILSIIDFLVWQQEDQWKSTQARWRISPSCF